MALSANAADWFISGAFQGWNNCQSGYEMAEDAANPGVFTYKVAEGKDFEGEFLIVKGTANNPDWNTKIGSNGSPVKADVAYSYRVGGGNFSMDGIVKNATITLDTNAKTLLVSGQAQENDYTTVYLVGDLGGGWNDSRTDYPLTLKAGTEDVWETSVTLTAATSYFKMRAGAYQYGTGGADIAVELGQEYTASQGGDSFSLGAGKYNIEFVLAKNASTGKLTVTADGPISYPEQIFVIGNVNNLEFAPGSTVALPATSVAGCYEGDVTFTGTLATGSSYFQLCTENGATWSALGTRYGASVADEDPTTAAVALTSNDLSWKVADGIYTIAVSLVDKTMTVTKKENPGPQPGQNLDVTFDFTSEAELAKLTPAPAPSADWTADGNTGNVYANMTEATLDNVKLSFVKLTSTANDIRYYKTSAGAYTLRFYKNNQMTIAAPEGYKVTGIEFSVSKDAAKIVLPEGAKGTMTVSSSKSVTWAAPTDEPQASVAFNNGGGTVQIYTINVTLVKDEVPTPPEPVVPEALYLSGNFTGEWAFNTPMTKEENKFSASFTVEAAAGYATFTTGEMTEWVVADGVRYGSGEGPVEVESATPYVMNEGSDNCWTMAAGLYDVVADFSGETPMVTFTRTGDLPTPPEPAVLYLRGALSGSDWPAVDEYKFTEAEGVYTLTIPSLSGAFKISTADWDNANTYSTSNAAMELGVEYDCPVAMGDNTDMALAAAAKDVTLTFDINTLKLTIEGTPDVVEVTYAVLSDLTDALWSTEPMTKVEGTEMWQYKATPLQAEGEMIIVSQENGVTKDYFKAQKDEAALAPGASVVLSANLPEADAANLKYALTTDHEFTFLFDPATGKLSVDGVDAIEGVDAEAVTPVYYNLQGVRVENPAEGLYIVVRGADVAKEYVR